MEQVKIASSAAKATVDPMGGRVASLEIEGHEVLVTEGPTPSSWGLTPMIPWCGHLDRGRLQYAGNDYDFPLTGGVHADDGLANAIRWPMVHSSESTVKLSTRLGQRWVFGGLVRQRVELTDESLLIEVQVEAEEFAAPVMIGWRPWFRSRLDIGAEAAVHATPSARYELDDLGLPTGRRVSIGPRPWNDCMVGLAKPPVITWPDAVEITVDSGFDHWILATDAKEAVSVAPLSGPPNQLNAEPPLIAPGGRLMGWMSISWG